MQRNFIQHLGAFYLQNMDFLFPDEVVPSNYNVTFCKNKSQKISIEELSKQIVEKRLDKFDRIVVLGGKMLCRYSKKGV